MRVVHRDHMNSPDPDGDGPDRDGRRPAPDASGPGCDGDGPRPPRNRSAPGWRHSTSAMSKVRTWLLVVRDPTVSVHIREADGPPSGGASPNPDADGPRPDAG